MKYSIKNRNRRNFLQIAGATVGLTGAGVASAKAKHEKFRGYTYNPQTQEILGEASATVVRNKNGIQGTIRLPNLTLPFRSSNSLYSRSSEYTIYRYAIRSNANDEKWGKNHQQKRFSVDLSSIQNNGIGGTIYDSKAGSRFAFSLSNITKGANRAMIKQELMKVQDAHQGGNQ